MVDTFPSRDRTKTDEGDTFSNVPALESQRSSLLRFSTREQQLELFNQIDWPSHRISQYTLTLVLLPTSTQANSDSHNLIVEILSHGFLLSIFTFKQVF